VLPKQNLAAQPRNLRVISGASRGCKTLFRECKHSQRLLPVDSGKPLEELIDRRTGLKIFEKRLHRDTRAFESPRAAQRVCRTLNRRARAPIDHLSILSPLDGSSKFSRFSAPQMSNVLDTTWFSVIKPADGVGSFLSGSFQQFAVLRRVLVNDYYLVGATPPAIQ
jgi:hypothetical protein